MAFSDHAQPTRRSQMTIISKLLRDEAGATAIEYGLIAALIAVAAIAAMQGLGGALTTTFNNTSSSMTSAA
jgi:pilus assembly protein Flp/PilA